MRKAIMFVIAFCLFTIKVNAQTESNNVVKINLPSFVKEYNDNGFTFHKKYDGKVLEFDTKINWISERCWFVSKGIFPPCLGISGGQDFGSSQARMEDENVLYSLHKGQEIKLQCLLDSVHGDEFYYKNCIIINKKEK